MNKIISFISDSFKEVREHVTWLTARELEITTILLVVAMIIITAVVGGMDASLKFIMTKLYNIL